MTIPYPASPTGFWAATAMIAAIILCSTTGEVLTAATMKSVGDLDDIRAHSGLRGAIRAVLTLVTNAIAGKIFLKENVDHRRWTAAVLVCIGVYFLAH